MEPASIRYKNPGAMWGGNPITKKWGELGKVTLHDGLGQGNNIAVFPTFVAGICAQIDLWRSARYRNKTFRAAITVWSGGNYVDSYLAFVKKRVPTMTDDTIMNDALLHSATGAAFLKAQAWHEAGKPYPAPDSDWIKAQQIVFSNAPPPSVANNPKPKTATAVIVGSATAGGAAAKVAVDSGVQTSTILLCVAAAVVVVGIAVWRFHFRHKEIITGGGNVLVPPQLPEGNNNGLDRSS